MSGLDGVDGKLQSLSLDETNFPSPDSSSTSTSSSFGSNKQTKPKTSLLSSSLAHEKLKKSQSANGTDSDQETLRSQSTDQSINELPGGYQISSIIEQSSPSLLASSVGKSFDGRLITSSSLISLLSLNNQNDDDYGCKNDDSFSKISGAQNIDQFSSSSSNNINIASTSLNRNSLNLNSWRPNHLNQQRLSHYQSSLPKISSKIASPIMSPSSQQTSPRAIPSSSANYVPDSPNLIPTSLVGSPTQFWLASPPGSVSNSLNQSYFQQDSMNQMSSLHPPNNITNILQSPGTSYRSRRTSFNQSQSQPISIPNKNPSSSNGVINSGNMSPVLHPVQTPREAPPMTPLLLSGMSFNQNYGELSLDDIE